MRERDPDCPVMIVTAFGTVETAVEAMRLGAFDFLQKPFAPEVVRLKVARALELRAERRARERAEAESAALRADAAAPYRFAEIVGETPAMRAVFQTIEKVAPDRRVGLHPRRVGNGQGAGGARHPRPLEAGQWPVRQGQLRRAHRDAAGVRAVRSREGGVHRRHQAQARAGSSWPTRGPCSSTRSATSRRGCSSSCCASCRSASSSGWAARRPSRSTCACCPRPTATSRRRWPAGRFREDLFYRLHVVPCDVPPLRERKRGHPAPGRRTSSPSWRRAPTRRARGIDDAALARLCTYAWPGNVRELENVIEQALVFAEGDEHRRAARCRPSLRGGLPENALALPGGRDVAARPARGSRAPAHPARLRQERRGEDRDGAAARHQDQRALLQARKIRHRRHREPGRQGVSLVSRATAVETLLEDGPPGGGGGAVTRSREARRARLRVLAVAARGEAVAIGCAATPMPVAGIAGSPCREGRASYYGRGFAGRKTASGERFDPNAMTAAAPSLPFGTRVRVTAPTGLGDGPDQRSLRLSGRPHRRPLRGRRPKAGHDQGGRGDGASRGDRG